MGTKTDDLIVVSRDGVNYKATGTQLFDFEGGATFGGDVAGVKGTFTGDVAGVKGSFYDQVTADGGYKLSQLPALEDL